MRRFDLSFVWLQQAECHWANRVGVPRLSLHTDAFSGWTPLVTAWRDMSGPPQPLIWPGCPQVHLPNPHESSLDKVWYKKLSYYYFFFKSCLLFQIYILFSLLSLVAHSWLTKKWSLRCSTKKKQCVCKLVCSFPKVCNDFKNTFSQRLILSLFFPVKHVVFKSNVIWGVQLTLSHHIKSNLILFACRVTLCSYYVRASLGPHLLI